MNAKQFTNNHGNDHIGVKTSTLLDLSTNSIAVNCGRGIDPPVGFIVHCYSEKLARPENFKNIVTIDSDLMNTQGSACLVSSFVNAHTTT